MPRIRTIKPEFWDDEKISKISLEARLTYIGLWNFCDDFGVTKANPVWIKNKIYPYDQGLSIGKFSGWIDELKKIERVKEFTVNGESYLFITNFLKHQIINKPSKTTRNPPPPNEISDTQGAPPERSSSTTGALLEQYAEEGKGREGNRKGKEGIILCSKNFEIFWNSYPQKVAKRRAAQTWEKLFREKKLPAIEIIVESINRQIEHKKRLVESGCFCPEWKYPSTWLNSGCWEDECVMPETRGNGNRTLTQAELDEWARN